MAFDNEQSHLLQLIKASDIHTADNVEKLRGRIHEARIKLKEADFWLRYLEPIVYKKINGPLPVEWETEVFEKFEKPYKRIGAGLTLAELYLDENECNKDSLMSLIDSSVLAVETYKADSITNQLKTYHHFYLCNRLFLLNLAAIYTTGFECPDTTRIIPELQEMLESTRGIYNSFNESFADKKLSEEYINLYDKAIAFVGSQPANYTSFNHFNFIKDFVNPLLQ